MGKGGNVYKELLLWEAEPAPEQSTVLVKGRNPELVERRNEKIAYRFVYWLKRHPQYRYEVHLAQLAQEFDLAEVTIGEIIQQTGDVIARIKKEWPAVKELKERWPWIVW